VTHHARRRALLPRVLSLLACDGIVTTAVVAVTLLSAGTVVYTVVRPGGTQ
jgi:hypothetical protein